MKLRLASTSSFCMAGKTVIPKFFIRPSRNFFIAANKHSSIHRISPTLPPYSTMKLASTASHAASSTAAIRPDEQVPQNLVSLGWHKDTIAIITLNSPTNLNAMTEDMGIQLANMVEELKKNTNLRVVILTGAGRAFSAGGDAKFLLARCHDTPANNVRIMLKFYRLYLSLLDLPCPIIAAINGPCVGAGACIATVCDFRLAAASVKPNIGFVFASLGLHPGMGGTHTLPLVIGHAHATRLLLMGELLTPQDALDIGFLHSIHNDPVHLQQAALALAQSLAAFPETGQKSLLMTLRSRFRDGLDKALEREALSQATSYASPEMLERVLAMQKPKPKL